MNEVKELGVTLKELLGDRTPMYMLYKKVVMVMQAALYNLAKQSPGSNNVRSNVRRSSLSKSADKL